MLPNSKNTELLSGNCPAANDDGPIELNEPDPASVYQYCRAALGRLIAEMEQTNTLKK